MSVSSPIVVAHVLLRSAPDGTQVLDHFAAAGFDTSIPHAQSITLMGSADRFERHFHVRLMNGPSGFTARTLTGRRRTDPTALPVGSLPAAIRKQIASIGLDSGAELNDPPETGLAI
jgi:hypothetical protein